MSVGTTQLEKVPKNMKSLCFLEWMTCIYKILGKIQLSGSRVKELCMTKRSPLLHDNYFNVELHPDSSMGRLGFALQGQLIERGSFQQCHGCEASTVVSVADVQCSSATGSST